jgi:hypothetical protein
MATLTSQVWVVLAVIAGVGVLSILHYIAATFSNAAYVHDLRVRVSAIRKDQAERLKAITEAAEAAERESMAIAAQVTRKAA